MLYYVGLQNSNVCIDFEALSRRESTNINERFALRKYVWKKLFTDIRQYRFLFCNNTIVYHLLQNKSLSETWR